MGEKVALEPGVEPSAHTPTLSPSTWVDSGKQPYSETHEASFKCL